MRIRNRAHNRILTDGAQRRLIAAMVALTLMFLMGGNSVYGTSRTASGRTTSGDNVLRTVSSVELGRFYIRLRPFPGKPEISRSQALRTVRELAPGRNVLEAVPALVWQSDRTWWVRDWVVSLKPYPQLTPFPIEPGHPKLNQPRYRKPFLIMFVSARTGRYDGERFEFWRGFYWRTPCMDPPIHLRAYVFKRGKWRPSPTVRNSETGDNDPVLKTGRLVRLSLFVSPPACFDRFSRAYVYFRKVYVNNHGVSQYRSFGWGLHAWLRGTLIGNTWVFTWQTRLRLRPVSHRLVAAWLFSTADGEIGPSMLIHVGFAG